MTWLYGISIGGQSPNGGQNIGDNVSATAAKSSQNFGAKESAAAAKSCQNIGDKESAATKFLDITLSGGNSRIGGLTGFLLQ